MNLSTGEGFKHMLQPKAREDDEIDLAQIVGTLWRGRWVIGTCSALAILVGGYYAYGVAVPKYQARTTLALNVRNEQVVDLESVISGVSTDQSAMNTELEVIRSRGLLETLVRDLDLTSDPEFNSVLRPKPAFSLGKIKSAVRSVFPLGTPGATAPDTPSTTTDEPQDRDMLRTVGAVRGAISATVQRQTYIFDIMAKTEQPMKSTRIANRLAELYIADQIEVKFQAIENAVSWLSERSVELENELREKEDQLKAFRASSDLVNAESIDVLAQQARDLRERVAGTQTQLATQQAELDLVRTAANSDDIGSLVRLLNDSILTELAEGIGTQGDALRDQFDARVALLIGRLESEIARNQEQLAALQASYERGQIQLDRESENLVQLNQLQREIDSTRTLYETFLTRLKETTIQRGLQQSDSRILSRANPGGYVEPRKSRILVMSMMLGLMLGCGIVILRQFVNRSFRTADELEQTTGIAVFGQVPRMPIKKRPDLITYLRDKPTSAAAEAIRNLRTSLLLSNIDSPPQIIMSTSSIPGEGKTTQAIALAQNLSGLNKRVLLVEGDIRRRTFSQYFKTSTKAGLLSVLSEDVPMEEAIFRDDVLGADVLMGEKSAANAADVLSSTRFSDFLEKLRKSYDFIIIDTPPVLVVPDARVIAQYADAIVYSVNWDRTTKDQVQDGLREFQSVNVKVSGLVLAQIDPAGMKRYGYGGKYGPYWKYGSKYYEV